MVQLSFVEEIKDKATRLIPTAYMEIVEECTAPHLLIPTYEHVKFLCETVNKKPDAIVDVVRALRRRIADNDVAVKHLTVQLLESMIKNSSTSFHIEVASQKGLLRDLVNVACMQPMTGRAMQAKEAALLLTLNLSIWFRGHPAEECYILTTLADDVRNQLGPNCFEGIEPERNTRVKVQVNTPAAARSNPRADPRAGGARSAPSKSASSHRPVKRDIIDAIPIDLPTPDRVSAMLDVCMTFSEYLNNVAMDAHAPLMEDEVVQSYLSQVKADHDYVTILLSSNLQIDRDVMRTVADSQSAVFAKVEKSAAQSAAAAKAQTAPVPVQQAPVRSAGDTEGQQQQHTPRGAALGTTPAPATPPRAEVAAGATFAAAPAPLPPSPPRNPAPSVDDLFGDAAAASVSSSNAVSAELSAAAPAVAAPETSTNSSVPAPPPSEVPAAESAHVDPVVPAAEEPKEGEEPQEEKDEEEPTSKARGEAEAEDKAEEKEKEEEHKEEAAAAPLQETLKVAAVPAAPAVPAAAAPKDDDDFDAFLEGRMST